MKHNKKQPFTKTKKAMSVALAAVLAVLGIGGIKLAFDKKSNDDDTTIVQPEDLGLILTEDFDINDKDAVRKRAEDIFNISEKDITIEEIMNVIYFVNGKYESLILNGTDRENVINLKNISGDAYDLLLDHIIDDANALATFKFGKDAMVEKDEEIFAYMFLAQGAEKDKALELARIIKKQLNLIETAPIMEELEVNSEEYYKMVMELKDDTSLSDAGKVIILLDTKSKNPLFAFLTDEKFENLDKDYYNTALNKAFFEALEVQKLVDAYNKWLDEARENGTLGQPITKLEEKYDKEDAKEAVTHPAIKNEEKETVVVDQGGNKTNTSTGKQEIIKPSEPTTNVETETFTEPVTEGKVEVTIPGKDGEDETFVVEVPSGGGQVEIVVPGGDVVGEEILTEYETTSSYESKEEYVDDEAKKADELAQTFIK